ncbi:MAG: LCP family protein [Lachnospiraceae bacterium]|nr:LCP family protein [Lachnospiraceae bacterium]
MKSGKFIEKLHISTAYIFCNIPLFILELLLLAVTLYAANFIVKMTMIQRVSINEADIVVNERAEEEVTVKEPGDSESVLGDTGFKNIALFGVDSRDGSLDMGRSDTIMIASINLETHEIRLVSVYRDTFLNVGNDSYNKCNVAYAKGGAKQAMNMLNRNFDLDVTDYVTVGFDGLIKAIDALGGVEIDVKENEIVHLNNYQKSMFMEDENDTANLNEDIEEVTKSGLQTLSGLQATAYCRIRYVGDDYARTERQRSVIKAMLEKAATVSPTKLTSTAYAIMPYMSTSFTIGEILAVVGDVKQYSMAESSGLPYEEYRTAGNLGSYGSCIVPVTLSQNVVELHGSLFGEEDYRVSSEVSLISSEIEEKTDRYLNE